MIIVKLMGGLGNQMFQYAAAKSLALKLNVELKIDLSYLLTRNPQKDFTFRNYELNHFDIHDKIISKYEYDKFNKSAQKYHLLKLDKINFKLFNNLFPFPKVIPYHESDFLKKFFSISKNSVLDGYWQSELYFKNIKGIIHQSFKLKNTDIVQSVESYAKGWQQIQKVSVHFRRGDYATNEHIKSVHGLCSKDYYIKSMNHLVEKYKNPLFIFISDDIEWVKNNYSDLTSIYNIEFSSSSNSMLYDLQLMRTCDHNIIANSSFSWWGAWLNNNNDKTVIAPIEWFAGNKKDTTDLIPKEWIRM